jgi:hypothetical protein
MLARLLAETSFMTEWVLLLLLIPAIVIPIVLLFGFAGCDLIFTLKDPIIRLANLGATAESRSSITLRWDFLGMAASRFEVRRKRSLDADFELVTPANFTDTEFTDEGLDEDTSYDFRVVAIELGNNETSAPVEVTASTMGKVFETALPIETDGQNRCLVQRIEPTRLARSGSRVQLSLQRPSAAPLIINRLSLSHAATSGDPYDSDGPPTLLVDIAAPLFIAADPAAGAEVLPAIDFALDQTRPLLVAFDIGAVGRVTTQAAASPGEATAFASPPTTEEAAVADRQSGYTLLNTIFLVQRIDAG